MCFISILIHFVFDILISVVRSWSNVLKMEDFRSLRFMPWIPHRFASRNDLDRWEKRKTQSFLMRQLTIQPPSQYCCRWSASHPSPRHTPSMDLVRQRYWKDPLQPCKLIGQIDGQVPVVVSIGLAVLSLRKDCRKKASKMMSETVKQNICHMSFDVAISHQSIIDTTLQHVENYIIQKTATYGEHWKLDRQFGLSVRMSTTKPCRRI